MVREPVGVGSRVPEGEAVTRTVTYITDVPSDANSSFRMSRSVLLMMSMLRRGFDPAFRTGCGLDARIQMDYALESPEEIPAGACEQYETEVDDGEDGKGSEQAVMASQIVLRREEP